MKLGETLKVKVCPRHFKLAPSYAGSECPLGQALKELFPGKKIEVGAYGCHIGVEEFWLDIKKWGGTISHPENEFPGEKIDELCKQAKISLKGIPTKTITLTKGTYLFS